MLGTQYGMMMVLYNTHTYFFSHKQNIRLSIKQLKKENTELFRKGYYFTFYIHYSNDFNLTEVMRKVV